MAKQLSSEAKKKLFRRHDVKELIVAELGLSEENGVRTVRRLIANNKPNGKLTTEAVIKILTRELKMSKNELLTTSKNGIPVKSGNKSNRSIISG